VGLTDHLFYISAGSNLGDKLGHLRRGIRDLILTGCDVIKFSSIYETEAVGMAHDTPSFYNLCIFGKTQYTAEEFLKILLEIEEKNGRNRRNVEGIQPRNLDLDLILFDKMISQTNLLHLPHPRYRLRKFVLIPLLELDPNLIDPLEMKPIREYLVDTLDDTHVRKLDVHLIGSDF
jgi:2-amino-4-hydroxy-6-hydroxymethyldihydropteridine diphosphokinase